MFQPDGALPTLEMVVSSADQAASLESFLAATGVPHVQVRIIDSEEAEEAFVRDIGFRRAAGEDVTVSYPSRR